MEGTLWAPPLVPVGWEEWPEFVEVAPKIAGSLETALGSVRSPASGDGLSPSAGVWYDPSHVALLPFWRAHHPGLRAAVITWRSPGATVVDLTGRDIRPLHALALWETQLVTAMQATEGMPVLGVDVDLAVANVGNWVGTVAKFAEGLGFVLQDGGRDRAGLALQASAERLPLADRPPGPEEAESATRMAGWLSSVAGPHRQWRPPADLAAGSWPMALLDAHLASHRSARSAADAWMVADGAYRNAVAADRDTASAVDALDWAVDRLVDAWASGRLTDGGPPTLSEA